VALLSETHLKSGERFFIPYYHTSHINGFPGRKDGTAVAVRKENFHKHVDLPPITVAAGFKA
jgi:hypothetical protein